MRKLRWWVWVVVFTVGSVAVFYAVGIGMMLRTNLPFQAIRDSVAPVSWTLEKYDSDTATDLFGSCFAVLFPRTCLDSQDRYALPGGEYSLDELVSALEASGAQVISAECKPLNTEKVGWFTLCKAVGIKDDYRVSISASVYVDYDDSVSDVKGQIRVRPVASG